MAVGQEPARTTDDSLLEAFEYRPGQIPVGRTLHYHKSNLDGTRPSLIAERWCTESRIESFKYTPGHPDATLIVAEMDWKTFSVREFQNFQVSKDGSRTLRGKMAPEVSADHLPWHSYDFDLGSLNLAMRFLVDPEGEAQFAVCDYGPLPAGGRGFLFRGMVDLIFAGEVKRGEVDAYLYEIDGPGLQDRGGHVWVKPGEDPYFLAFEIDLPDEPGMTSGKLELQDVETLADEEWQEFLETRTRK
jgi:hypothetical protein